VYLCPSFTSEPPDQFPPTRGRFLTQVWPRQPNPWPGGTPKLQNLNRSLEKILRYKKCIIFFPGSTRPWLVSCKYITLRHYKCILQLSSGNFQESVLFERTPDDPQSWDHFGCFHDDLVHLSIPTELVVKEYSQHLHIKFDPIFTLSCCLIVLVNPFLNCFSLLHLNIDIHTCQLFNFFPFWSIKISSGGVKKFLGQRLVGLLFTTGQKYACVGSGQGPFLNFNSFDLKLQLKLSQDEFIREKLHP